MKKALPIILLLAAVAAAILHFASRPPKVLDLPRGLAARIAPPNTVVFVEAPDIARTFERWKQTGIALMAQEPEWKEFIAKAPGFFADFEATKDLLPMAEGMHKADGAGLFLAITELKAPIPALVGGFPYRGKKSDVESVVRKLKEQLLKAWPGAKSDLSKHGDIEIETITSATASAIDRSRFMFTDGDLNVPSSAPAPGPVFPKVHLAYQANWFYFATDLALLTGTLDRHLQKPGATSGLAQDPVFQEDLKHSNVDPDLTVWTRWPALSPYLSQLGMDLFDFDESKPAPKDPEPILSVLYSLKLDGLLMRDRLFFHATTPPKGGPLENRLLGFTGPDAFVSLTLDTGMFPKWFQMLSASEANEELQKSLKKSGLAVDDFFSAFGSELLLTSAWPAGGIMPDFCGALEVRDPVKARKIAEWLVATQSEGEGDQRRIVPTTEGGITRWAEPVDADDPEANAERAMLALSDKHLLYGTVVGVDKALKDFAAKSPNIATKPGSAFPGAVATVRPATGALLYLDLKTLVERLYTQFKPDLASELADDEDVAKYFDASKIPPVSSITKHLAPVAISHSTDGPGWLVDSTGRLPALGTIFGAATLTFGIDAAFTPTPTPALSPQETQATADLEALGSKLDEYQKDHGAYPTTAQGLAALVTRPPVEPIPKDWKQRLPAIPTDPWGKPYQYVSPGIRDPAGKDLFSSGPDGIPGNADDFTGGAYDPALTPQQERATSDVETIDEHLEKYQKEHGAYPTAGQGLNALVTRPTVEPIPKVWKQLMPAIPLDPWGKPYQYRSPGTENTDGVDVFSSGPDGILGNADDITNW